MRAKTATTDSFEAEECEPGIRGAGRRGVLQMTSAHMVALLPLSETVALDLAFVPTPTCQFFQWNTSHGHTYDVPSPTREIASWISPLLLMTCEHRSSQILKPHRAADAA